MPSSQRDGFFVVVSFGLDILVPCVFGVNIERGEARPSWNNLCLSSFYCNSCFVYLLGFMTAFIRWLGGYVFPFGSL